MAIVGQGNVAVDVARILLAPVDALRRTDITASALAALHASTVQRVYLVGRRGPLQAAFTIKELREMTKLPDVQCRWRPDDFLGIADELPNLTRPRKRLTELMLGSLAANSSADDGGTQREFRPIFMRSPLQVEPDNRLRLSVNRLVGARAEPTAATELLECDLVMRSIGYKAINLDESVNFNAARGHVNHHDGRVLKMLDGRADAATIDHIEDKFEEGLYASGWLATGPTGVILTTMSNSFAVAKTVCDDFAAGRIAIANDKPGLSDAELQDKPVVGWAGWERIDRWETDAVQGTEKPREKIVDVQQMLSVAGVV